MNIADRIQHLRKQKGISQEELADKIGVSRQAVSKWESEQSTPDVEKLILLSDYFETTTDYLLKGIEPVKEYEKKWNAPVFSVAGTVCNAAGLVLTICIWIERRTAYAAGIGLIFMLLGTGIFLTGQLIGSKEKEKAREFFLLPNVWILSFLPVMYFFYIASSFSGYLAPVPLPSWGDALLLFVVRWSVYIILCVAVDMAVIKRRRK